MKQLLEEAQLDIVAMKDPVSKKMEIEHYLEVLDIALTELTVHPFLQPDQNPSNAT